MVYTPSGRSFSVDLEKLSGDEVKAWWYNPRDGKAEVIGTFAGTGQREFVPPSAGEMLDWVLVLDDASQGYPPPGTRRE